MAPRSGRAIRGAEFSFQENPVGVNNTRDKRSKED
jgi:hypothetical protein